MADEDDNGGPINYPTGSRKSIRRIESDDDEDIHVITKFSSSSMASSWNGDENVHERQGSPTKPAGSPSKKSKGLVDMTNMV